MHSTQENLTKKIEEAKKLVEVGGRYFHYKKGKDFPYKVLSLALLEANEEVAVVYQAEYGDDARRLIWVRALDSWLGEVETPDGKKDEKKKRFEKM